MVFSTVPSHFRSSEIVVVQEFGIVPHHIESAAFRPPFWSKRTNDDVVSGRNGAR
jgi:hypothetical protein